jgi:thiol:disulfide interchange protein DsbA
MKKWLLMALLLVSGFANAASELGKDYVLMAKPQPVANPKKVEVIEFSLTPASIVSIWTR